jgi:integrating conjugative element membrane protein (TIGR03747 family)
MNAPANATARQETRQLSLFARIVTLPFQLFGLLCAMLFLCILLEWFCMFFFWPGEGWHHAEEMLTRELDQLSEDFRRGILLSEPGTRAREAVDATREVLIVKSGFMDWSREATLRAQASGPDRARTFRDVLGLIHVQLEHYLMAAVYRALGFLARLMVLALSAPLFILAAFVGLVDGLVRRDIRKFQAGAESGFLYHRARASLRPLAVLPWGLYLGSPVFVHPLLILLPAAVLLGVAVDIAAGSFKKYL